ncbi:MAG: hypothetical protein SGI89_14670 [bacterium]|nr:hypothetical protein [bacterium]
MNKRQEKQKSEEKAILTRFIQEYVKQIDSNFELRILENEEAKLSYPKYNGENPDFVVQFSKEHIGVELFQLSKTVFASNYINLTGIEAQNMGQLHSKTQVQKNNDLLETEELASVAIERINGKVEKAENYINLPIWLVGYVPITYNSRMVLSVIEDNITKEVKEYINSKIEMNDRIAKIWLAEFRSESHLFEIK